MTLVERPREEALRIDRPVAGLLRDLRQRGMLDDTLIIFSSEFGRTPFREGRTAGGSVLGRDHYPDCFTIMLAGGGVKGGTSYGETDELGHEAAVHRHHIRDLHATESAFS